MAHPPKILVIYSNYYSDITDGLMAGATKVLNKAEAKVQRLEVPGVLEIPAALAMAAQTLSEDGTAFIPTNRYDGYVLLGCVIRGETTHYEIVANESARAIMDLMCTNNLALGNGIQTVENHQQAKVRADINDKDKGGAAARAALDMIEFRNKLVR